MVLTFLFISAISERVLEESYHGLIKENETFVELTPVIKIDESKICRLEMVKSQKDIPFKVRREAFDKEFLMKFSNFRLSWKRTLGSSKQKEL